MNKRRFLIISLIVLCVSVLSSEESKTRVAVLDFSATGVKEYLAEAVVENLITSLIDSGAFEVVERSQLRKLMNELSMQNSDDFNDDLRTELGNLYGVELVILGSVTRFGDNITINVRGVEVETGIARFAKNFVTSSEDDIPFLIPLLVDIMTGKKIDVAALPDKGELEIINISEAKSEKKEFIGQFPLNHGWESESFKPDKEFSKIIIEVRYNCAEIASVKISFHDDGDDISIKNNFMLGDNYEASRTIILGSWDGQVRKVKKVYVKGKTRKSSGSKDAEVLIYGVK